MNESNADLIQSGKTAVVDGPRPWPTSREKKVPITKRLTNSVGTFRSSALLAVALLAGVGVISKFLCEPFVLRAHAQPNASLKAGDVHEGQPELTRALGELPDQSHVMADVGYHFANLWFAAGKQNWPLANYYLNQTRSHLKWAVRIHPVRQTKAGDVDLNGIAEAIDNSLLSEIGNAISNKNSTTFNTAYRQTLVGCYACHAACEKPFLRPQIPETPGAPIINPDPDAKWP